MSRAHFFRGAPGAIEGDDAGLGDAGGGATLAARATESPPAVGFRPAASGEGPALSASLL